MDHRIYMDHAATTGVRPEVLEAMLPYFSERFGNASSIHSFGREARVAVDAARKQVANAINAEGSGTIYFTSGGTEADNWAIKGFCARNAKKGKHIITSAIEHHAVLHTCQALEKQGFSVTYLPVDEHGLISLDDLRAAITDQTILITVMFANNEIGTVEPIAEIGAIAREHSIAFHTDAVQAVGSLPIDVQAMKIDLLSMSAHKFYGPKGIGALYVRKGILLNNLIDGGAQESGKRGGTTNTPLIVGMGKAIELAVSEIDAYGAKLKEMQRYLIDTIPGTIPYVRLNGHPEKRLPGNVNVSIEYIEGESMLLALDLKGIAGSSGSACTSGSLDPSHVLLAIGLPHEIAHGSLRLSLGWDNTLDDCRYVAEELVGIVEKLREMSPLFPKGQSLFKAENGGVKYV